MLAWAPHPARCRCFPHVKRRISPAIALPYISPVIMAEYRQSIERFARGATSVECIRSHYFPDRSGVCALTGAKDQEELFVLSNRLSATMKVSRQAMQIVANVVDIKGADEWFEHLRVQKKAERERKAAEAQRREEAAKAPKAVLFRRKPTELLDKNKT